MEEIANEIAEKNKQEEEKAEKKKLVSFCFMNLPCNGTHRI